MDKIKFDTLVLSGGGSGGGIAIAGALTYLNEKKLLKNTSKYCGTSIGSLVLSLLMVGYDHTELYEITIKSFQNIIWKSIPFYGQRQR